MKRFFASDRFIELLKIQIFNQKCCNNANCRNNFENKTDKDQKTKIEQNAQMNLEEKDSIHRKLSNLLYNEDEIIK